MPNNKHHKHDAQDTYDMQSTQHSPATAALSTTNVVEQIEQIRRAIEESNTETAERQVARPLTTARDADRARVLNALAGLHRPKGEILERARIACEAR